MAIGREACPSTLNQPRSSALGPFLWLYQKISKQFADDKRLKLGRRRRSQVIKPIRYDAMKISSCERFCHVRYTLQSKLMTNYQMPTEPTCVAQIAMKIAKYAVSIFPHNVGKHARILGTSSTLTQVPTRRVMKRWTQYSTWWATRPFIGWQANHPAAWHNYSISNLQWQSPTLHYVPPEAAMLINRAFH